MNVVSDRCDASQQLHNELQHRVRLLRTRKSKIATSPKRYPKETNILRSRCVNLPDFEILRNHQEVTHSNLYLDPFLASHLPHGIFNHG